MDISAAFKASVRTVSSRRKALEDDEATLPVKKKREKCIFRTKSRALVMEIFELRKLLLEKRWAYLNFSNLMTSKGRMSDQERDSLDAGAQKIMSACSQALKELRRNTAEALDLSQQNLEHREVLLLLMEEYLKSVCKIYSEQKALRVRRAMDMHKMAKLGGTRQSSDDRSVEMSDKSKLNNAKELSADRKDQATNSTDSSPLKVQEMNGDVNTLNYEEELSAEDVQMFESENEQLYNELNTITEEVKQIESKVVDIAQLQEIFTEKVLDQDRDLDRLITTVVGSTENVKEANEQIRQAIQRNAGLRAWILFFLLVMSFSLLFLDWYNP